MKKIRKFEIVTVTLVLVASLFVLNGVYAQNNSLDAVNTKNVDVEPQKVMTTNTDEVSDSNEEASLTEEEVKENVKTVAETVDEIRTEAKETEDEVKNTVKIGIDKNIINIRKQSDIPAYELQKAVDDDRIDLFEDLDTSLKSVNVTNFENLEIFSTTVEEKVEKIQNALEEKSGIDADFEEEKANIKRALNRLRENIASKKDLIEKREGDTVYKDTDQDGLSDYDEKYIYGTDPENPSTSGDDKSDSEKISSGLNPISGSKIDYQDPRQDVDSYVTSAYRLEKVSLTKKDEGEVLRFEGRSIPNSFVTLYIYSTPIIVTVKADANGDWSYELDHELENGEHQFYVATVNNSGKIIARSNPVTFTKTAEAASIGIVGIDVETSKAGDFFRDNFILIALAILIGVVVIALMIIGRGGSVQETIKEIKDEVDNPPVDPSQKTDLK